MGRIPSSIFLFRSFSDDQQEGFRDFFQKRWHKGDEFFDVTEEKMKDVLTPAELESLATGAAVITLELASRFLADYLSGDRYFRIDFPEQNLRRAQAQLVLFEDMLAHMADMKQIIREATQKEEELKIYTIYKT